jgi:hypothetical protein
MVGIRRQSVSVRQAAGAAGRRVTASAAPFKNKIRPEVNTQSDTQLHPILRSDTEIHRKKLITGLRTALQNRIFGCNRVCNQISRHPDHEGAQAHIGSRTCKTRRAESLAIGPHNTTTHHPLHRLRSDNESY